MRCLHRLRRTHRSRRDNLSGPLLSLIAISLSAAALGGLAAGSALLGLAAELSEVSRIEGQFGLRGAEAFRPLLLYDRTGEVVLFQNLPPGAADRVWVDPEELPQHVVQTTLAALDPTFWTNPGYELPGLADGSSATITQRLAAAALLPPANGEASPTARNLQNVLLAAELTRRYPKERILAWYLNSADYGRSAYGIDAAGLVYFGKHALDLTLAESSMLAALALEPDLDLLSSPEAARSRQAAVLDRMVAAAELMRAEADRAGDQPLRLQSASMAWQPPDFASYALQQVRSLLGPGILSRSGVRVILSLDSDLQQQATCAAESHAERLRGSPAGTVIPASDGTPCVAAALLPTLRPSDVGLDHQLEAWGVVVTDPQRGEILAAAGPVRQSRPVGPVLSPFLYLTAFSRGSSPSTMVNDLGPPLEGASGPVRMRTALAGLLPGPEASMLAALGEDSLLRSLVQLGLQSVPGEEGELRTQRANLLDLAKAYGVLAAGGRSRGLQLADGSIVPTIVLRVDESDGTPHYHFEPGEQAIVSPQLAYLLVSVLSDEPARWSSLGSPNLLEIGRPAGVLSGSSPEEDTNWAIGFTPNRVVGAFISGTPLREVDRLNGAASLWHAIIRFGSAGLPAQGWDLPPGLNEKEVCDPSGLLPTTYCPEVVREVFIQGSEPTRYDNLYQPFRLNAETGKLATLFTPLASIEEHVYFVPPPEAE
ncbi:MAG: transglycosylase domain-containing protein, partial [Anaerolineales bacterium]